MLTVLELLAEVYLNQVLVVLCGYFLGKKLLRLNTNELTLAPVYTLGVLWFTVIGAIALISPIPKLTIWGLILLLFSLLIRRTDCSFSSLLQKYRSLCLYPFLLFLTFGAYFLFHFSDAEITKGIDPWVLIDRTLSYRVPDHYLQWIVSDNFFNNNRIETFFNPDGKQLWSAGDRPVLLGLLESTFSQLSGNRSMSLYFLRVILFASLLIPALSMFLKSTLQVTQTWKRFLILLVISLHPFFLINIIFTWPKMAGLAFGMLGFVLFSKALEDRKYNYAFIGGIAFALGAMCHTAAVFCVLAAAIFFPMRGIIKSNKDSTPFWSSIKLGLAALLPIIILTQIHSRLLAGVTNQTNLLTRVQLCRGGSYAFPTPVESVYESCRKYIERQGLSGVIEDRKQSFARAFNFQPSKTLHDYAVLFQNISSSGETLRSLNAAFLLNVPQTIGMFAPIFLGLFALLYALYSKLPALSFTSSSLLMPIGFVLLIAYSCMLGEFTEMSSHVVPYVVPLFIHLGLLTELSRLPKVFLPTYAIGSLLLSVSIALARAGWI